MLPRQAEALAEEGTSEDADDDEADAAVQSYNLAVVHYNRHEFVAASNVLDKVFRVVEAVEEGVARRVCLLLLDLYIVLYRPDKAALVLQCLERLASAGGGTAEDKKGGNGGGSKEDGGASTDLLKFQLHQCASLSPHCFPCSQNGHFLLFLVS